MNLSFHIPYASAYLFHIPICKSGYGLLPDLRHLAGRRLLRRHKLHILRFHAERESSSIPLRLLSKSQSRCWIAILCFLRTSVQRGLFLPRRTHTRCRGRKPHTAATRASRRGAGARHTRRVDRADLFHGRKIGTIGTFKGNPPFAVAAVGIRQNPFFS